MVVIIQTICNVITWPGIHLVLATVSLLTAFWAVLQVNDKLMLMFQRLWTIIIHIEIQKQKQSSVYRLFRRDKYLRFSE